MGEPMYDVVVLGGGGGGVPAAVRASQLGGRVVIVEKKDLGGFCMNRGCIPFTHMMTAVRILGNIPLGKSIGLHFSGLTKDYTLLQRRGQELIAFMGQGVRSMLKKNKVTFIEGRGRIKGKGALDVDGKEITFKKLVLAAGTRWRKPDFPGADLEGVVNTDDLLTMKALPESAVLFGESPWLLEIAQFLAVYGCKVTLAVPGKRILSEESKTIAARLRKKLKDDGIEIQTLGGIERVAKRSGGLTVSFSAQGNPQQRDVDLLITLERDASLKGLGLETIGLDEESAFLPVNDKAETAVEGVYAIGDVTAPPGKRYSHRAAGMGLVAAENAMGHEAFINPGSLVRVLFTHPEVAAIGLTPKEAKQQGYDVIVGTAPLAMNPLGMILAEDEGVVEVVGDKKYGEILGVHILGPGASEMTGAALCCIKLEATLDTLAGMAFPHPTLSESLAEAARDALGKPIYLPR
jgi:dihydrolipoamide dehydrogenase